MSNQYIPEKETGDPIHETAHYQQYARSYDFDSDMPYILQIPPEITLLIFNHAVTSHYYSPLSSRHETCPPPEVTVSHVCHVWRSLSLECAQLWVNFFHKGPVTSSTINRLVTFLARSETKLVNLWFDFEVYHSSDDMVMPSGIHERLALVHKTLLHAPRWNSFTLKALGTSIVRMMLADLLSIVPAAPNLKHYSFCIGNTKERFAFPQNLEGMSFRKNTPILKSVVLDASFLQLGRPPLTNVTTLRLEMPHLDPFRKLPLPWPLFIELISLPILESLSIDGNIPEGIDFDRNTVILLKNLKHLRYSGERNIGCLLPQLAAPRLQSLVVRDEWFPKEPDLNTMNIRPRPFPSLQTLSLIHPSPAAREFIDYFIHLTSSATEVIIIEKEDTNVLATLSGLGRTLWPKLQVLTCVFDPGLKIKLVDLVCLVEGQEERIVVQVLTKANEFWQLEHPEWYGMLTHFSEVESLGDHHPLWHASWPPGDEELDHFFDFEDPFRIHSFRSD